MSELNPTQEFAVDANKQGADYRLPLAAMSTLFFLWGFITVLNDILIPHLKDTFSLNYTQAMLIQFCFFSAYFLVSVPAGALVRRVGYKNGIISGLCLAATGCLLFYPAAEIHQYWLFLTALFVLASGLTVLQVSANPYVASLGSARTASSRLNLAQALNSLGTTLAPAFGGLLFFSSTATLATAAASSDAVKVPYLLLASALLLIAIAFAFIKLPELRHIEAKADDNEADNNSPTIWQVPHLVLGAVAIFFYVGAEVAIGSFIINYLGETSVAGMEESEAAKMLVYYWGGAMVGRFVGAAVTRVIEPQIALMFSAVMVVLLLIITMMTSGDVAVWSVLAIGLFNSIMFPTIFSLAIEGLGKLTSRGSGLLCLAIVGGAILPLVQGVIADIFHIQISFVVPALCYLFILWYGFSVKRLIKEYKNTVTS